MRALMGAGPLKLVRTSVFTLANGMRPYSQGVPRILMVLGYGLANPHFEPYAEAALIQDAEIQVTVVVLQ